MNCFMVIHPMMNNPRWRTVRCYEPSYDELSYDKQSTMMNRPTMYDEPLVMNRPVMKRPLTN